LVFVAYRNPTQAALALVNISMQPEFADHELSVNWHKKKSIVGEESKGDPD